MEKIHIVTYDAEDCKSSALVAEAYDETTYKSVAPAVENIPAGSEVLMLDASGTTLVTTDEEIVIEKEAPVADLYHYGTQDNFYQVESVEQGGYRMVVDPSDQHVDNEMSNKTAVDLNNL